MTITRFHLGGAEATVRVSDNDFRLAPKSAVAISPWEPHSFQPTEGEGTCLCLTLYIKPMWFLENSRSAEFVLSFGNAAVAMTPEVSQWVGRLTSLLLDAQASERFDGFLYETTRTCFDQSWDGVEGQPLQHCLERTFNDFRVRRSLRLMQENFTEETAIDDLAREVGLSRPHFFKLFKMQMRITPNLYLNTLRAEQAIDDLLTTSKSVTDIGFDLGFSSQASFSRFFTSNVGIPPTDYRRVAHVI